MQFSTKEDIEASIDQVFAALTDFESFERAALRRGVDVRRRGQHDGVTPGMIWDAKFSLRGTLRDVAIELTDVTQPSHLGIDGTSRGMATRVNVELMELSPRRTRMSVGLKLAPKTLSARLFVQSLKLAKSGLNKRFKTKVASLANTIEDRTNGGMA